MTKSKTIDRTADCTVRALARVAGINWYEAERTMIKHGYEAGAGASIPATAVAAWDHLGKPQVRGNIGALGSMVGSAGRHIVFAYHESGVLHAMAVENGRIYNRQGLDDNAAIVAVLSWS